MGSDWDDLQNIIYKAVERISQETNNDLVARQVDVYSFGWVVHYAPRQYMETGSIWYRPIGGGYLAFIIERTDQSIYQVDYYNKYVEFHDFMLLYSHQREQLGKNHAKAMQVCITEFEK